MGNKYSRLYDQTGPDTACTYPHLFSLTVLDRPDPLEIGVPALLGLVMGMTDIIAHNRSLATYFTHLCHFACSSYIN